MRPEALIKCNQRVTEGHGRVRDLGLVASAANRPDAVVGNEHAYPAPELKAAAILQSVVRDRPFTEGNDSTAWLAMLLLLRCFGLKPGIDGCGIAHLIDVIAKEHTDVAWIATQLAVEPVE
ncbi:Fic family protein [Nocardia sp. NPDC059240]|uniref:Fic family protein n=1 Tax=Nocardia sp. NPDC059240 TaxID=3346786 RepID=UPI0036CB160E